MLYIVPPDKYSSNDGVTISAAKTVILLGGSSANYKAENVVRYLISICGRYHYVGSHVHNWPTISAANAILVDMLSKLEVSSLTPEQWVAVIHSLATDSPIPLSVFSSIVQETTDSKDELIQICPPYLGSVPYAPMQNTLCRANKSAIVQTGILDRFVYSLWPKVLVDACSDVMHQKAQQDSVVLESINIISTSKLLSCILSIDWENILPSSLLRDLVVSSLLICSKFLQNEKSFEEDRVFHTVDVHLKSSMRFLSSRPNDASEAFVVSLFGMYQNIIEQNMAKDELLIAVETFLGVLPWLSVPSTGFVVPLQTTIWKTLLNLLSNLEELIKLQHVSKKKVEQDTMISIASPEIDDVEADSVDENWLDSILTRVPLDMDRQAAREKDRSFRVIRIQRVIASLFNFVPCAEISGCDDIICEVFRKVRHTSSSCPWSNEDKYSTVSSFGLELQNRLVRECVKDGGPNAEFVLKFILAGAASISQNDLAIGALRQLFSNLNSGIQKCDEHCFSEPQLGLVALRFVTKQEDLNELAVDFLAMFRRVYSSGERRELMLSPIIFMLHVLFCGTFPLPGGDFEELRAHYKVEPILVPDVPSLSRDGSDLSYAVRCIFEYSILIADDWIPYHFPVFTEHELTNSEDLSVMTYMFRLFPLYKTDLGKQLIQRFYGKDSSMLAKIETYFSDVHLADFFPKILKIFTEKLEMERPTSLSIAVLDCICLAISFNLTDNPSFITNVRTMLRAMDLFEIREACVFLNCIEALDRLNCVFRIYRNPLLCEIVDIKSVVPLHDNILKLIQDSKYPSICPVASVFDVSLQEARAASDAKVVFDPQLCFRAMRSEIASHIFSRFISESKDVPKELVSFALEVSSSAHYSRKDADMATLVLQKVESDSNLFKLHNLFLMNTILAGCTNIQPTKSVEIKPMAPQFASMFSSLLLSNRYSQEVWKDDVQNQLLICLLRCSEDETKHVGFTPALACELAKMIDLKVSRSDLYRLVMEFFTSQFDQFSSWIARSPCVPAFLAEIAPILRELHITGNIDQCRISELMEGCAKLLVRPSVIEDLFHAYPIHVQHSERFGQANLRFIGSNSSRSQQCYSLEENRLVFHEALSLVCRFGSNSAYIKVVRLTCEYLNEWLDEKNCAGKVLSGESVLQSDSQHILVFRIMVVSALFGFCSELFSRCTERAESGFYSDSESLKSLINRKGGPTALPSVLRRTEQSSKMSHSGSRCTYYSTEEQFVQQHWYNCYTCGMVETVGVCGVCAVNCHRGHDLVYSKLGQFFCDCGAGGCEALRTTAHESSSSNASRGRTLPSDISNDSCPVDDNEKSMYEFSCDFEVSSDDLLNEMERFGSTLDRNKDVLQVMVSGCQKAHLQLWTVDAKREQARLSLQSMAPVNIDYSQEIMEKNSCMNSLHVVSNNRRMTDTSEGALGKDMSGVVRLENGKLLWLLVDGPTLLIHHIETSCKHMHDEISTARMDTETLPFSARRLSCMDDKVVIVGKNDVMLLRFARDGDIVDRTALVFGEISTHTNPIVKAVWAPRRPAIVAVATIQFVRVFDVTMDISQHLEDLVLPVGNVEDIQLLEDDSGLSILVFSSIGHLYKHKLTVSVPQNASYFLTNTIELPSPQETGSAVSVYYSEISHALLCSFENGTWLTFIQDGNLLSDDLHIHWNKLEVENCLDCWHESCGVIGALTQQGPAVYIYPTNNKVIVQKVDHNKRTPFSHVLFPSDSNDLLYALLSFPDSPNTAVYSTKWTSLPDLWIEKLPLELNSQQRNTVEDAREEIPRDDLVTMMERCEVVERVEVVSPQLARFYDSLDLGTRLQTVGRMSISAVQVDAFVISFRVLDPNVIVRAIRIEVPAQIGPVEVVVCGITQNLRTEKSRFFDVLLTRSQSIALDPRSVSLSFSCRDVRETTTLKSIRLFGISRREFGFPRAQVFSRPPLSLSDSLVLNYVKMLDSLIRKNHLQKDRHQILDLIVSLCSYRNSHRDIIRISSRLLRVLTPSRKVYYDLRDKIIIDDLKTLIDSKSNIPSLILPDIMEKIKYMLCTRYLPFCEYVDKTLGGSIVLMEYLYSQLAVCQDDVVPLLEVFVALTFVLLSSKDVDSSRITNLFLAVFTDPNVCHLSHKLRLVAQSQIYSFSLSTRNDRALARTLSSPLPLLEKGGLRPFFHKTKIIQPEEERNDIETMMGPLTTTESLNNSDMFDMEAEFLIRLLRGVLVKIAEEGSVGSMPRLGVTVSRNDSVPSTSLLIFAIVIMAQLYPARLYPTVVHLIGMVDWTRPSVVVNEENYRQFLLIRLISVLLSKCGEHVENKKKSSEDAKEGEKKLSSGDKAKASSASNVVDGSESAASGEGTSAISSGSEERVATKRRSTEKLLEQIVTQLAGAHVQSFCFEILSSLISYWRSGGRDGRSDRKLWARDTIPSPVDIGTLTLQGKGCTMDSHEHYLAMITDVSLRLPYQMKKICKNLVFEERWNSMLCELVTLHQAPQVRRHSKKLLVALCDGDKEAYRRVRSSHMMSSHIDMLKKKFSISSSSFSHQQLTEMVEIVSALSTTALSTCSSGGKPSVWRLVCEEQLSWLLQLSCRMADSVATSVLELLVTAIREEDRSGEEKPHLADIIIAGDDNRSFLKMLVVRYLIGKDENRRWLLHGMLRSILQLSTRQNQGILVRVLWKELWPLARGLGTHGSQLADILASYMPRLLSAGDMLSVCDTELGSIQDIAARIEKEGHAGTYRQMTGLGLGWKFMLMVTSPCLNCFSRKDTPETVKLNAIKQDARFSSNAMMIKLLGHYEIIKVIVKLSDVKRSKVVKKVNLFYCTKAVESPVELKTSPELWQKAGSALGTSSDGEIVVSLAIPVVTSSLVIQFAELAETRHSSELHCPRCSAVVQPNPGVCENCGENAFQCVKCRSINYDDKDPFLCQTCGFCKYARMDVNVLCRPLPGVQPITSDIDRNNAVDSMSRLLLEMEQSRVQLHAGRSLCEALWMRRRPLPPMDFQMETAESAETLINTLPHIDSCQHSVYGVLQALNHCKSAHEELCTQTQQLIAFREELRNYDHSTRTGPLLLHQAINQGFYSTSAQCFGCLCASILHSLAILQGICDEPSCADRLLDDVELYRQIVTLGTTYDPLRKETEALVRRLAYENPRGTKRMCDLVSDGVLGVHILTKSILGHCDSLWQVKMKVLIRNVVGKSNEENSLSHLMMVEKMLKEGRPIRKRIYRKVHRKTNQKRTISGAHRVFVSNASIGNGDAFAEWLRDEECNESQCTPPLPIDEEIETWLWSCVFSPWISVRSAGCRVVVALARHPGHLGVAVSLIVHGLSKVHKVPPQMTDQFFRAAHKIIGSGQQIKTRLFVEGVHVWLMTAIHKETKRMHEEEQQETSMNHSFGTLLRRYVELLSLILTGSVTSVESLLLKGASDHILISLLQSTIFLKRVILRRTRAVDASRSALELLLHRLSNKEPVVLLKAAVHSLCENLDHYTQVQIIAVILDILDPKPTKTEEFLINIEKDPAQEDFLQGRMSGNPYRSSDPGLGPLMRDIKNKICRDTEMIALLEDDNGMELLVDNQIISLKLTVRAIHSRLWRRLHPGQPMTIVYRMRGLLGDAVEPFVSSLRQLDQDTAANPAPGNTSDPDADSNLTLDALQDAFFSRCGGIQCSLSLIKNCDLTTGGRLLLIHMKRLVEKCMKEQGRKDLVIGGAVGVFMNVLRRCVDGHLNDDGVLAIALDYLKMMGDLVKDASTHEYLHHVHEEDAAWLITLAMRRPQAGAGGYPSEWRHVHMQLMMDAAELLGNLVLGDPGAEAVLVAECKKTLDWRSIDSNTDVNARGDSLADAERLSQIVAGILPSEKGQRLKSLILDSGIIADACEYLVSTHPPLYSVTETPDWKTFLVKPSLKLMLNFMNSMAKEHEASQQALAEKTLHILHRLEQVASDNSIGTLAENVVEALRENEMVATKIEAVRLETKQKKRQMAMAMRNKQLSKMGMQIGKQGEVKVSARKIANEPVLDDVSDPLVACCICREHVLHSTRAAAAYAFASTSEVDRESVICSVSQMVLVHIECHQSAIRRSGVGRNADEWTKASLHNAGAKCNVMTPLAVADSSTPAWTQAIQRYKSDLDVISPTADVTRALVFSDLCMLIDRFVSYTSFSEKSQGGGRESNAQYLAILHLLACDLPAVELPVLNPKWIVYSFLMTELSLAGWNEQRCDVLRSALDDALNRNIARSWDSLKPFCFAWAFVDRYFREVIPIADSDRLEWLKSHILETFRRTPEFVRKFDSDIAQSSDFQEFATVVDVPTAEYDAFFAEPTNH